MIIDSKNELRREMRAKRTALTEDERKEKSEEIKKKLFETPEFKNAGVIAFYLSKGSEVQTIEMIKEAVAFGKTVLVPVTNHEIELVKFTSFEDMAPAKFGVLEPKTKIVEDKEPDLIIVPGLAFDLGLQRLGYGKGHYDRLLKKLKSFRIGICFDNQIVKKLERHEHDQKLDIVISEMKIIGR